MKKLFSSLFLIAILVFSGCDKLNDLFENIDNNDDTTTMCRISKTVSSDGETTFDYSNDGLLTRMNNTNTWDIGIFYNGNAQVSKVEYYNKDTDSLDFYLEYTWINNSKVEQRFFEKDGNGQWIEFSRTGYDLNGDGDVTKVSHYEQFNNEYVVTGYEQYTIENGNVTKEETFVINSGTFEKHKTTTFQYDDKNNPYRNLSIKSISDINQYYWFTKNNPVKIVTTDDIVHNVVYSADYQYQYNDDDFPVSYTRIDSITGSTQTYTVSSMEYDCQ